MGRRVGRWQDRRAAAAGPAEGPQREGGLARPGSFYVRARVRRCQRSAASSGERRHRRRRVAREKAVRWLAETKTDDDPQSVAMRLVLWRRLGRPAGEWEPLARRIRERQNADGGWSQAEGMGSDAWATGQALYALARAGPGPDEPAVARAKAFLVRTQREDGSWPMTSRPVRPGGEGSKSLVPITGAGSAWAVLGLVRSR